MKHDEKMRRGLRIIFKEALRKALRAPLRLAQSPSPPFEVEARPLGLRSGIDLDHALRLASEIEDDEIIRKL